MKTCLHIPPYCSIRRLCFLPLLLLVVASVPAHSRTKAEYHTYDSIFASIHRKSVYANINLVQDDLRKMLQRAEREGSRYGKILAYLDLSAYSGSDGNIGDMLRYLEIGQAAIDPEDPPFLHAYSLFAEGSAHLLLSNYSIAIDDYSRAAETFRHLNDSAMLTKTYLNMATCYVYSNQPDMRIRYFSLAQALDMPVYRDLMNLTEANNMLWDGHYKEALDRLRKLKESNSQGPVSQQNCIYWFDYYNDLVAAYLMLEQLDSAYRYACTLTDISQRYGSRYRPAFPYLLQGRLLLYMHRPADALLFFQKVCDLYGQTPTSRLQEAIEGKIECYKLLNQHDNAIRCYDQLLQVKDSLAVQNLENNINIRRLQQINDKQQAQLEEQQKAYRSRLLWFTFALVILALSFLVFYQRKRLQERKEKVLALEKEMALQKTQNDLAKSQMEHAVRQEQLKDFQQQMRTVASSLPKHQRAALMEGINNMQDAQDKESWQQFLVNFRHQHGDFAERLTAAYPTLTTAEMKLCMLLRAGYSNKEAAQALHLTADSLKTYRQHLRSKFSLVGGREVLGDFLSNF